MTQKSQFLSGEGDAWFKRNAAALENQQLPESDALLVELLSLKGPLAGLQEGARVLEVGCGAGGRLAWLHKNRGMECFGVDPSELAVQKASYAGVRATVGTADDLPFADKSFDVLIFGFCLYLCDRDDLFKIAAEADRVLKTSGWLLIRDFYSPSPLANDYHHLAGVRSYKMDYKKIFTWNPDYCVYSHRVAHHEEGTFTDDQREWVATTVLRKCRQL